MTDIMNRHSSSEAERQEVNLSSLPAELRDIIYTYALVSKTKKNIHTSDSQPALLRTSRQLRVETIGLYYSANTFCFTVHAYRGTDVKPFCKLLQKYSKHGSKNFTIELCGDFRCDECRGWLQRNNLMAWLEAYYADEQLVPGLSQGHLHEYTRGRTLARRTFAVVENMRHVPWLNVETVLETFMDGILMFEDEDNLDETGYHQIIYSDEEDEDDSSEEDEGDSSEEDEDDGSEEDESDDDGESDEEDSTSDEEDESNEDEDESEENSSSKDDDSADESDMAMLSDDELD